MSGKTDKKSHEPEPSPSQEVVFVLDVHRSYFEICLSQAKSPEDRKELKEILKQANQERDPG